VEVGWTEVRAAEIEVRGNEARVLRTGRSPLPAGFWDDIGAHRDALAHTIRTVLNSAGIRTRSVVTVLPRRYVTIKYARLPQGTPEQVAGMVRFEAQQYVPFPIDEVVLDHMILSEPGDDMATVLIAAARKTLVNELLAAFDRAGVEVTRISVSSLALAELLRNEPVPAAICRLDGIQLDLAVAGAGRVYFSRSAEVAPLNEVTETTEPLVTELARSLTAYQTEYRTRPVEKLVVTGDSGLQDGMSEALAAGLQIQVSHWPPDGQRDPMPVLIGLALEETGDAASMLNLLPTERQQRKVEARRKTAVRLGLLAVAVVLAVGALLTGRALDAQAQERRRAIYENTRLKRIQPLARNAETSAERLRRMYLTVNFALGRDKPVVDVIKAISDALPRGKGVRLTQLTFDRNGPVVLHGNAENQESVTAFLLGLQTSNLFKEARLGYLGDASAANKLRNVAASAEAEGKQGELSFMLYCRLPEPPALDEKSDTLRRRTRTPAVAERTAP